MFLRVTAAKGHRYVQLVHNYRDPETRVTKTRVLHNFGREDQLDVEALRRLVQSISRFLDAPPPQSPQSSDPAGAPFQFLGGREFGGIWLLNQLWQNLGFASAVCDAVRAADSDGAAERWLFAAVAASLLAPHHTVPLASWVRDRAFVPGLVAGETGDIATTASLLSNHLRSIETGLHERMSSHGGDGMDTLFFGTALVSQGPGTGPMTLGLVVSGEGLPVRLWLWPGSFAAPQLAEQVGAALSQSALGHRLVALDAGTAPDGATRSPRGGSELLIVCERLAGRPGESSGPGGQAAPSTRRSSLASEIRELAINRDGARHRARVIYNFPLRNAGDELTADQISLGMRQVGDGAVRFGTLRQDLDDYTEGMGFEDRIRIHSLTRWLALLLIHVAELRIGRTWEEIAAALDPLQAGIYQTDEVQIWQTTPLSAATAAILAAAGADAPPQYLKVVPLHEPG